MPAEDIKFELSRLLSYDDESVFAEVRRVGGLVGSKPLTKARFDRLAKVSSSRLVHRFSPWRKVLEMAGLADRYSGTAVSLKMRRRAAHRMSNEEVLDCVRSVAQELGQHVLSQAEFNRRAPISARCVIARFGSWKDALAKIGLQLTAHGRRWTDEDYFENLLKVWTHYGRQPVCSEMNRSPSQIGDGAYQAKWGSWRKALVAFIERVNRDVPSSVGRVESPQSVESRPIQAAHDRKKKNPRNIPLGIRYKILSRDRFRCVLCGASPANYLNCKLHVDHIIPVSRGGNSETSNLRTLCSVCNLGKSNKYGRVAKKSSTTRIVEAC